MIFLYCRVFKGLDKITLLSYSYIMKTYSYPWEDITGNLPVWLEEYLAMLDVVNMLKKNELVATLRGS